MHLKNNNRNFLNHLVKLETFKPIIELTIKESYRDTLVSSSCQEFFEFMRRVRLAYISVGVYTYSIQENMKDIIAHVMTSYEDQVKQLSGSRYCGQCFRGFIRRHEMNIHPPPEVEEKPLPRFATVFISGSYLTKRFSSQPSEMRRIDLAEESYFNTDDEEDEDDSDAPGPHPAPTSPTLPQLHSPPLSRFQFAQKRRRQRTPGIPLRTGLGSGTQRVPTPATPIHLPRTPPINALVDYRDDDEPSSDPEDALLESLVAANKPTSSTASAAASAAATAATATTSTATSTPAPVPVPVPIAATGTCGGGFVPLRAEKRRRADEDEDEMGLERLVAGKSRRPAKVAAAAGTGEEGPKRIRLRFGAAGLAAAAAPTLPTAARSEPGTKDADTG